MNITSITEEANGILILVGDDYEYLIPKLQYADELDGCSEWIEHLLEKKWINKDALYSIAAILSKHTSGSKINWEDTFYSVERSFFIDGITDLEPMKPSYLINGTPIYSGSQYIEKAYRKIEIGRETHTKENTILMKKRVEQNLSKFGIVA
jgi:hypothetical protein